LPSNLASKSQTMLLLYQQTYSLSNILDLELGLFYPATILLFHYKVQWLVLADNLTNGNVHTVVSSMPTLIYLASGAAKVEELQPVLAVLALNLPVSFHGILILHIRM
jgi:hypothetical protein